MGLRELCERTLDPTQLFTALRMISVGVKHLCQRKISLFQFGDVSLGVHAEYVVVCLGLFDAVEVFLDADDDLRLFNGLADRNNLGLGLGLGDRHVDDLCLTFEFEFGVPHQGDRLPGKCRLPVVTNEQPAEP